MRSSETIVVFLMVLLWRRRLIVLSLTASSRRSRASVKRLLRGLEVLLRLWPRRPLRRHKVAIITERLTQGRRRLIVICLW